MNKLLFSLFILALTVCANQAAVTESNEIISQGQVISLLKERKVKGVFQPHFGYVSIDLKDGTTKWYAQEKVDWIIEYILENHKNELEYAAME